MTASAPRFTHWFVGAGLCVVIVVSMTGAVRALRHRFVTTRMPGRVLAPGEKPTPDPTDETQDVVILIGSSECHFAQDPRLQAAYQTIVSGVRRDARRDAHTVLRLGVAMDDEMSRGADWLRSVGQFDEVDVGGNWLNNSVIGYVWARGGQSSIPQILVVRRRIRRTAGVAARIIVGPPAVIHQAWGFPSIQALADSVNSQ